MLVFAAVIFRSEVALLLGTTVLYLVVAPAVSLKQVILPFTVASVMAVLISVPVDSYFWQKPLWPELWGFYYNAILGSSSNWGVSPWHYYFTSAIPRLLLNPLAWSVLIPLSLRHPACAPAAERLVIPPLLFVAIYSLQPHKEIRFIFYVVPSLTAAAALGANLVFNRRTKSLTASLLALTLVVSVLLSFATSIGMLLISSLNYPGGEALGYLRGIVQAEATRGSSPSAIVPVHADVLACMTGVTLFGTAIGSNMPNPRSGADDRLVAEQRGSGSGVSLLLDKTEDEAALVKGDFWRQFDYVLMEDPAKIKGGEWETVGVVQSYGGIEVIRGPDTDQQAGEALQAPIVGRGALVAEWKRHIRTWTKGWWVGPRMVPKIYVLRRVKESRAREAAEA